MAEETTIQSSQASVYPAAGASEMSREMIEAGVFYGRKKSKTNPKMRQFVIANRGGIEVINLEKTEEALAAAAAFVTEKIHNNGVALFVATEPAAEASLLAIAKKFGMPYVSNRWIGGSLTNFKIIAARVEHLKKIRADLASGALDKYTKKERVEIDREIQRLEELMGGLETMAREPDLLIMIDPELHTTAVREARIKKIPIVALANIDADPDLISYLVPGNDKAKKSIEWFLGKMEHAIEDGLKMRAAAALAKAEAAQKEAAATSTATAQMSAPETK
jgi:small subunit ribosomal protein S2